MNKFEKNEKQRQAIDLIGSNAKEILLYGGSRSGKTLIFLYSLIIRSLKVKSRHVILRHAFNHVKASIWHDSWPKTVTLCFPEIEKLLNYNKSDWFISFPNGSEIWFGGLDDKERTEKILGNEYSTIYLNEASQISYQSYLIAKTRLAENNTLKKKIYIDCNPPSVNHWLYRMFILKEDPVSRGLKLDNPDRYGAMVINPPDNPHLPGDYISDNLNSLPERQRKRFLLGEFSLDNEGALWNFEMIERNRVTDIPVMKKIVVAIDPAVTSDPDSDETGIVVFGKGVNDMGYVLDDVSGIYTPSQWARRSVEMYYKWKANYIVAETNNGGDLVEGNIKNMDRDVPVKQVKASRGKMVRAEPIVALYEEDKIKHTKYLDELESQMTTWNANEGDKSPDRVDALVWGATELMMKGKQLFVDSVNW